MTKETLLKNRLLKLLIPLIIFLGVIVIFKSGYKTGHWLYEITHK